MTAVKANPQPQVHYQPTNHKQEASFNGQSYVIEPSYLLKPYQVANQQNGYHAQPYQPHPIYPPQVHQVPAYHIPPYHSQVYQTPVLPQTNPYPSSIYQHQLYTSVALLAPYSGSSYPPGFYHHHQQPSRIVHQIQEYPQQFPGQIQSPSPVQSIKVVETAKPQIAVTDQPVDILITDPNDQDKRYIPEIGDRGQVKEAVQSKNEDDSAVKASESDSKLINQHGRDSSNRTPPVVKLTDVVFPPKSEVTSLDLSVITNKPVAVQEEEESAVPIEESDSSTDTVSIADIVTSRESSAEKQDNPVAEFLGKEDPSKDQQQKVTEIDQKETVDEIETIVDQVLGVEHKSSDDIEESISVEPVVENEAQLKVEDSDDSQDDPASTLYGVNQVNQTTTEKPADFLNADVQQADLRESDETTYSTLSTDQVTENSTKEESKKEPTTTELPSFKTDNRDASSEVEEYDSIFDEPMTKEDLQFFTPFDAQKIPKAEDLVVESEIKSAEPAKAVQQEPEIEKEAAVEQEPLEADSQTDINLEKETEKIETLPYHRFRLAGIGKQKEGTKIISTTQLEEDIQEEEEQPSVFDQEDLVRATKQTKQSESRRVSKPKPFAVPNKEEKFQIPFTQLKSLVTSEQENVPETDKADEQDVIFYSQVSQASLASRKERPELYFSSTKDTKVDAEQVTGEIDNPENQTEKLDPVFETNVPKSDEVQDQVETQDEDQEKKVKENIKAAAQKDFTDFWPSQIEEKDKVTETDPQPISFISETTDGPPAADDLVSVDVNAKDEEKLSEEQTSTKATRRRKQKTTTTTTTTATTVESNNSESGTEDEEDAVLDYTTEVGPNEKDQKIEKYAGDEEEAIPEFPLRFESTTSKLVIDVKQDLYTDGATKFSNKDEEGPQISATEEEVVDEDVSNNQEVITEVFDEAIPSSTDVPDYKDKKQEKDDQIQISVEVEPESPISNKNEEPVVPIEEVVSEEYLVNKSKSTEDHSVPCTGTKKEESDTRPEPHFNTAALANIPFESQETEVVEELTTLAPVDFIQQTSTPIAVSTVSTVNETTTSSPIEIESKKTTSRTPGRFYTGRANKQTSTPPTPAPQLVVIGKAQETRKPINGKIYARVSSLPQFKPPSLPKVNILPSRLRLPTSKQQAKDQKVDRRYFVGRPPVADKNPIAEEETEQNP